jgi:hypothetical protein
MLIFAPVFYADSKNRPLNDIIATKCVIFVVRVVVNVVSKRNFKRII